MGNVSRVKFEAKNEKGFWEKKWEEFPTQSFGAYLIVFAKLPEPTRIYSYFCFVIK
jgi:hypothetical protein